MKHTNGDKPAYPVEGLHGITGGLTKRELIAAMAMQGMIASGRWVQAEIDHEAVKFADALLHKLAVSP